MPGSSNSPPLPSKWVLGVGRVRGILNPLPRWQSSQKGSAFRLGPVAKGIRPCSWAITPQGVPAFVDLVESTELPLVQSQEDSLLLIQASAAPFSQAGWAQLSPLLLVCSEVIQ